LRETALRSNLHPVEPESGSSGAAGPAARGRDFSVPCPAVETAGYYQPSATRDCAFRYAARGPAARGRSDFSVLVPPLKRRATTSRPLAGTARSAPLRCATAWRRKEEEDFWGALFTAINGRSSTQSRSAALRAGLRR